MGGNWGFKSDRLLGGRITYAYNPFGNLTRTTDPAGNVTTMTYDLRGRKSAMTDPDMGSSTYAYNAAGELLQQTDAKLQVTTLTYDKLGRILTRTEPGLTSTWIYDTAVKGIGKLTQATSNNGFARAYTYDTIGRVSQIATTIEGVAYNMAYSYDFRGRIDKVTYPTGFQTQNLYNSLGYLEKYRIPQHSKFIGPRPGLTRI